MDQYLSLKKNIYVLNHFSIVPLRYQDRYDIMNWRNEQKYHLRQRDDLNVKTQDLYFDNIVKNLFQKQYPNQILFSYLKGKKCIGYGGLVHINWKKKEAEISFIMNTKLEYKCFDFHWSQFLFLIEDVAFNNLNFIRLFTCAYNLRPHLYDVLLKNHYNEESIIKSDNLNKSKDVYVHSKVSNKFQLKLARKEYIHNAYKWLCDPLIRKYSFETVKTNFQSHTKWFIKKINDKDCYYFFSFYGNKICGSIRFDKSNKGFKISYLIDKEFHGLGFGKLLLHLGEMRLKSIIESKVKLYGDVVQNNISSIKIFENLSYNSTNLSKSIIRFKKTIK
ncbi:MAG: GNAT family N-acetyltransferase [Flavobacteriaceae bacterium]|jgi:RimJ/RimL family protein N-acetyltransferase|nr:GNAT family N-acetyltransferase [Flavobacteriaceae bacterium]